MEVRKSSGFYDLCINIPQNEVQNLHTVLSKLCEYGYKTVAINTNINENVFGTDKKKKKSGDSKISQGVLFETVDIENIRKVFDGRLKIFNRITFSCTDFAKTHILNQCPNFKKYDLYAFAPRTQNSLQYACTQLNADIITLRPNPNVSFKLNKKLYDQAVERGIHFEIQYADLLNVEFRKTAIHYSHLFHTYGKSKVYKIINIHIIYILFIK